MEICCLCIRRNLVDRMIELPWNADEERHLHKCLLDFAAEDPSTATGSLLVVFYLQRHRYVEAYQVDQKLQSVAVNFISQDSISEEVLARIRAIDQWRTCLVNKGVELLPDILQQQLRAGKLPEVVFTSDDTANKSVKSNIAEAQEHIFTSLLANPSTDSTLVQRVDIVNPSVLDATPKLGGLLNLSSFKIGHYGSPTSTARLFNDAERILKPGSILGKNLKFDAIATPANRRNNPPASVGDISRKSSREHSIGNLLNSQTYRVSPEKSQNGFLKESQIFRKTAGNHVNTLSSNHGMLTDSDADSYMNYTRKSLLSDAADRPRMLQSNDSMDISWSHEEKGSPSVYAEANGGPRWRSDDTSEEEDYSSANGPAGGFSPAPVSRGVRRSRVAWR